MEITDFGFFQSINGKPGMALLFFENEDGLDWYEMRFALTEWEPATGTFANAVYGAWATVDVDGIVTNVEQDPSRLVPDNKTVLGIDAGYWEIQPGMLYRDGQLETPQ